jgi:hypothetical protein
MLSCFFFNFFWLNAGSPGRVLLTVPVSGFVSLTRVGQSRARSVHVPYRLEISPIFSCFLLQSTFYHTSTSASPLLGQSRPILFPFGEQESGGSFPGDRCIGLSPGGRRRCVEGASLNKVRPLWSSLESWWRRQPRWGIIGGARHGAGRTANSTAGHCCVCPAPSACAAARRSASGRIHQGPPLLPKLLRAWFFPSRGGSRRGGGFHALFPGRLTAVRVLGSTVNGVVLCTCPFPLSTRRSRLLLPTTAAASSRRMSRSTRSHTVTPPRRAAWPRR